MKPEIFAALVIRLFGFVLLVLSVWQLLTGLVQSFGEVDPTYLGYFFQKVLVGPVLGLGIGGFLLASGSILGRWLSRGLSS